MALLQSPFFVDMKVSTKVCRRNLHRNHVRNIIYNRDFSTASNSAKLERRSQDDVLPFKDNNKKTTLEDVMESSSNSGIGVASFLQGKSFFITGATGFLGKALIEKILRAIPNVRKMFVLIKAKNKEAAMDKLKVEIIESELFEGLKQVHGESYEAFMLSKLVPVVGNICEPNLGIDDVNFIDEIAEKVDIIINSAGNTTFDERYDVALNTNTKGPVRLISFAKKCNNLCLFIHVSTAYVNGKREGIIMEKPFNLGESIASELDMNVEKLALDLMEATVEDEYGVGSSQKIEDFDFNTAIDYGWRNTYEFTKAMGEMLINNWRGEVPVVIIRPSIIESTYKEPFPGWIQGNRMMDPMIVSYGKGRLPGFVLDTEAFVDLIPVDMVVNAIIATMAKHGRAIKEPSIEVYNVTSSFANPLTYGDLIKFNEEYFISFPFVDSKGKTIENEAWKVFKSIDDFSSYIKTEILQKSGLFDLTINSNHKVSQRLVKQCQKVVDNAISLAKTYEPYTFYRGRFHNGNTQELILAMSEEETASFGFDVNNINWKDYIMNVHIPGLQCIPSPLNFEGADGCFCEAFDTVQGADGILNEFRGLMGFS